MERLTKLSWRGRGRGASTCIAEVDQPIRGFRTKSKDPRSRPLGMAEPDDAIPLVSWISFDGDTYWVRLAAARGWPRTIRVTQADVDGAIQGSSE